MLALALQRPGLGEVQLGREDRDVAGQRAAVPGDLTAGGGRGRLVERGPLDLARLVDLEDVALAEVVEALEQDAALEALGHLAGVVLEALELRDRRLVDPGAVAEDAHARAAPDDAARDHAAGDRADARGAEERAHLDLADHGLGLDRREHADERLLDLLGELVDDAVLADLDPLPLGELRAPRWTGAR